MHCAQTAEAVRWLRLLRSVEADYERFIVGTSRMRAPLATAKAVTRAGTVLPVAVVALGLLCIAFAIPATSGLSLPLWMPWVVFIYAANSLIALFVYAFDKGAATQRQYRVPEKTLHLIEFLGGWPGALIAQQVFRHKNRKPAFLIWTGLIVLAHVVFWIWMSLR